MALWQTPPVTRLDSELFGARALTWSIRSTWHSWASRLNSDMNNHHSPVSSGQVSTESSPPLLIGCPSGWFHRKAKAKWALRAALPLSQARAEVCQLRDTANRVPLQQALRQQAAAHPEPFVSTCLTQRLNHGPGLQLGQNGAALFQPMGFFG